METGDTICPVMFKLPAWAKDLMIDEIISTTKSYRNLILYQKATDWKMKFVVHVLTDVGMHCLAYHT